MNFRFNLKWLLLLIAVCAGTAAWLTQAGMVVGHFEIKENSLYLDGAGTVDGSIQWRFSQADDYSHAYSDYVCSLNNIDRPKLTKIAPGDSTRIRYRLHAIGPLPAQNPHIIFIQRRLGIPSARILGIVQMDGWTNIVIEGQTQTPSP